MRQLLTFFIIMLISQCVLANTLRVLDKNSNPLHDAIITFPHKEAVSSLTHTITQKKYQFTPAVLVINKGDTVLFPNKDKVIHHIYSFSKTGVFEMYLKKGDLNNSITFDKAGIAILGCNIHDSMTGYIHILDNEKHLVTNRKGEVKFDENLPQLLYVWHQNMSGDKNMRITLTVEKTKNKNWIAKTNILNLPNKKIKKSGRY